MKTARAPAKTARRPTRVSRSSTTRRGTRHLPAHAGRAIAVVPENRRKPLIALIILVGIGVALLWVPAARWVSPKKTLLWTGYQTVAVRGDHFTEADVSTLAALLGPGVVSDATSTAEFWDFAGFARVRYADLDARLDPLDPRRDSYIEGAGGYFHAVSRGIPWRVLYVPARRTGLGLSLALWRSLGFPMHGEWRLVDFDPLEKGVSVVAVLGLAVLLALSLEQGRRAMLAPTCAGAALWVPFVLRGGLADLALTLGLLLAWFPLLRTFFLLRGHDGQFMKGLLRPLLVYCGAAAAGLVLSLLPSGPVASRLIGLLCPFVCSLIVLPALRLITVVTSPWRRRRSLFEPVPTTFASNAYSRIVRPSGDAIRGRSVSPFFALILLVVVAVLPITRGVSLPTPLAVTGASDFSWRSLQKLSRTSRTMHLPDIADFVAHAAFQETLGFGRPWRLPSPDERVYVREYSPNTVTGAIDARLRRVKAFDETWRTGLRKRADAGSLEAMLFAQGRPVAAAIRGPGRALFRELPVTLGVLLALLALLARDFGLGPLIRGNLLRSTMVARRNQTP